MEVALNNKTGRYILNKFTGYINKKIKTAK
jgi:hypothetical protein